MKKFPCIELCRDKQYLYDHLNESELQLIENILQAESEGKIILPEDRYNENGDINFESLDVIIYDKTYVQNGYELLVLKWIYDFEDTGYLVENIHEEENIMKKIEVKVTCDTELYHDTINVNIDDYTKATKIVKKYIKEKPYTSDIHFGEYMYNLHSHLEYYGITVYDVREE